MCWAKAKPKSQPCTHAVSFKKALASRDRHASGHPGQHFIQPLQTTAGIRLAQRKRLATVKCGLAQIKQASQAN